MTRGLGRRLLHMAALGGVLSGSVAVILVSPLLFGLIAKGTTRWSHLGDVGQAYGGIGAVLSGLALAGIIISLHLQRRQADADRILSVRKQHFDLVRLGIEEPELLGRSSNAQADRKTLLFQTHANLWVAHWAMLWDLRHCDERQLRVLAGQFFSASTARSWWHRYGAAWSTVDTRSRRRFQAILDEECRRAALAADSRRGPVWAGPGRGRQFRIPKGGSGAVRWGMVAGMVALGTVIAVQQIRRVPRRGGP